MTVELRESTEFEDIVFMSQVESQARSVEIKADPVGRAKEQMTVSRTMVGVENWKNKNSSFVFLKAPPPICILIGRSRMEFALMEIVNEKYWMPFEPVTRL